MIELTSCQKNMDIKLSIIIVCFNSRDVLFRCLESIWDALPSFPFEVILVDNGSKDGGIEEARRRFPETRIIETGSNGGYAGGNNIGFANARGVYVLFLNPDTIIQDGAFNRLVQRADSDPEIAIVGPSILRIDGTRQRSCFRAPCIREALAKTFWLHRIPGYISAYGYPGEYREEQYRDEMEVDDVTGCCLLARKAILNEIGVFDEDYFLYFEDTDLCERVRKHGYKIFYDPSASIVHVGGATTIKHEIWCRIQFERSHQRFFAKHRSSWHARAIGAIQMVNWAMRVFIGSILVVASAGRAKSIVHTVHYTSKLLFWRLGIEKEGRRPS
jgi:N-acetylglucosaminyl-diphospho-decaprenol L-rhamnosyltransferase